MAAEPKDPDETLQSDAAESRRPPRELSTFNPPAARFTRGEELGRGGMGKVIAARDVSLRRGVAIKQVLFDDAVNLERFEREVRITAELEHPSIVPIHDVGTDEQGHPFYVMRHVRGEPLSDRISRAGTLRERLTLLPSMLAVADAAAFAHARRIIHRDLKPSNILIGSFGETLLIDWGLARRLDDVEAIVPDAAHSLPGEPLTVAGHVYGTAGYMSPEQARGESVDARADVYALGATLFHLLVGRGPFDGMRVADRIEAAVSDAPPPLALLPLETPSELRAITTKAMATDPAARYPDAGGVATDLRAFLEGRLVAAHHYTLRERVLRFARRHRGMIVVATLAMIAVVVVGIAALVRVTRQETETEAAEIGAGIARLSTEDREQRILLGQASLLAEVDPVRAIGRLRHLPASSPHWRTAHDIAAKAAARGIPRGDRLHHSQPTALAFSPDRRYLASADGKGHLVVRTLSNEITANLKLQGGIYYLAWLDGARLLASSNDGLAMIAAATGQVRMVARGHDVGGFTIADPADRIRFVDNARKELLEVELATERIRVIATDVDAVYAHGERVVISGRQGVRWLLPQRQIVVSSVPLRTALSLALSEDGRRLAVAIDDLVIEWDDTGRELRRWEVRRGLFPTYSHNALYVVTIDSIFLLGSAGAHEIVMHRKRVVSAGSTAIGTRFMLDDGSLLLASRAHIREFDLTRRLVRHATSTPDATLIAVSTIEGEVLWWDLSQMVLDESTLDDFTTLCDADARNVYVFLRGGDLVMIDRATRQQRSLGIRSEPMLGHCVGMLGHRLAIKNQNGFQIADTDTGKVEDLDAIGLVIDPELDAILFARGNQLFQLDHGIGPPRVIFTTASPIQAIVTRGRWLGVRFDDGSLIRLDRLTGTTTTITKWDGVFWVGVAGEVWFSQGPWLWRWTEAGPFPITRFPQPIHSLQGDGAPMMVVLTDNTVWTATAARIQQIGRQGLALLAGSANVAVFRERKQLVLHATKSDEQISFQLTDFAIFARVSSDVRVLLVGLLGGWAIHVDSIPYDPVALAAWLAAATNGMVDKQSDAFNWHTTSRAP